MKDFIKYVNMSFDGIIHNCPYKGTVRIINGSLDAENNERQSLLDNVQKFPNGLYIFTAIYRRKKDENIFTFTMTYEVYFRENHLISYDTL